MKAWVAVVLPLLLISCTNAEKLDVSQLKVPSGFHIAIFAEAPHARMLAFSPGNVLLVTDTEDGKVLALPDPQHSGEPAKFCRAIRVSDAWAI